MKKTLSLLLSIMIVLSFSPLTYSENAITERPEQKIFIEGQPVNFTEVPIEVNGRVLLPLRALLAALGVPGGDGHIQWDAAARSVTVIDGSREIYLQQGSTTAYVDGKEMKLDAAPVGYAKNGRTYIPVRFIAENLGKKVLWDSGTRNIYITGENKGPALQEEPGDQNTIRIGAILPISGPIAAYGAKTRDAIKLAVEEINAKGGILGKKLELIVEDDETNPEKAYNAFKKLAKSDRVTGVIGSLTSRCTLAIGKEAQSEKVVLISPTATNDMVTDAGDYVFRACYNDSYQGGLVAKFSTESLKAKKAAILFDNTNDYSAGLKDKFKKEFEELGGKIVFEEGYTLGDKDFNPPLVKMKAANPDILFIPDYYTTASLIIKQARELGINTVMVGADGWEGIAEYGGDEAVGTYYSNHFSPDNPDSGVREFVREYSSQFNVKPDSLAALSYDALYILAEAVQRAGSTEPEKIRAEVMKTDGRFVTGNIRFDENRNPIKPVIMVKIQKAGSKLEAVYDSTVQP